MTNLVKTKGREAKTRPDWTSSGEYKWRSTLSLANGRAQGGAKKWFMDEEYMKLGGEIDADTEEMEADDGLKGTVQGEDIRWGTLGPMLAIWRWGWWVSVQLEGCRIQKEVNETDDGLQELQMFMELKSFVCSVCTIPVQTEKYWFSVWFWY